MAKKLDCTEKGCGGRVLMSTEAFIQTGCRSYKVAHPCDICGFLHFVEEENITYGVDNGHQKAFLIKGEVHHKKIEEKI